MKDQLKVGLLLICACGGPWILQAELIPGLTMVYSQTAIRPQGPKPTQSVTNVLSINLTTNSLKLNASEIYSSIERATDRFELYHTSKQFVHRTGKPNPKPLVSFSTPIFFVNNDLDSIKSLRTVSWTNQNGFGVHRLGRISDLSTNSNEKVELPRSKISTSLQLPGFQVNDEEFVIRSEMTLTNLTQIGTNSDLTTIVYELKSITPMKFDPSEFLPPTNYAEVSVAPEIRLAAPPIAHSTLGNPVLQKLMLNNPPDQTSPPLHRYSDDLPGGSRSIRK